ncbi:MAG TPA: hypothetical protein PK251_16170 [Candidatus Latescibacteria bacterium]|nr:hypothetical protein [Candidatus Latescibacterota bacterium]HOS66273.1 hypothetical protein [Candidatus Latescibacterota bacterium]HRT29269.1 hypothetical protein [Kiritimatiellia bacterium]
MCEKKFGIVVLSVVPFGLCAVADANLFPQGDFEKDKTGGWHCPSDEWRVADGVGYKGSRGFVMDIADAAKTKWPWTDRIAVEPGVKYRVSLRAKRDTLTCDGGQISVGVGWKDADSKGLGAITTVEQTDNAVGQDGWFRMEATTPPLPPDAKTAIFYVWAPSSAKGRMFFDDFAIEAVSTEPGVDAVHTSEYRDLAVTGDVEVRALYFANPLKYPVTSLKGFFEIVTPVGVKRFAAVRMNEGVAEGRFAAAELTEGTHPLKFVLETADGKYLGDKAIPFTRVKELPKRKVWIDRHHRAIVDGKPFFPLGAYWSRINWEDLLIYTNGPFNCLMPYHRPDRAALDLCQKLGLRVMYPTQGTYKGVTGQHSLDYAHETVKNFGDHPAILAWYICDELPVALADRLEARNRLLREIDPDHPTWIVTDKPQDVQPLLSGYDVIGMDPYPVGNHGDADRTTIGIASDWVRRANESTFGFKPMWNVPQAFNWGQYRPEDKRPEVKMPTYEEMRSMAWQSIAAGANGLVFYSFFDLVKRENDAIHKRAWNDLLKIVREIHAHVSVMLSVETAPAAVIEGATEKGYGDVVCRTWRKDGRTWLLACNRMRKPVKAVVTVGSIRKTLELAPIGVVFEEVK